jgi:hypothetical protein
MLWYMPKIAIYSNIFFFSLPNKKEKTRERKRKRGERERGKQSVRAWKVVRSRWTEFDKCKSILDRETILSTNDLVSFLSITSYSKTD